MNINSISGFHQYTQRKNYNQNENKINQNTSMTKPTELYPKFNDRLLVLSFGERVDKGLERFFKVNSGEMPSTVFRYVEALEDKNSLTPLEAQKRAFNKLETAQTVKDIKKAYPDEELFDSLIEPKDSKATRGLLNSVRENDELLSLYDKGVLKDKTDLSVYLVKKIFLEAKTIDEMNKDLENDLDEDFAADFKAKNKGKETQYIYGSTLSSLGIKTPSFKYMQSLRYTRNGYSDMVGEKISKGQRDFWDSLSTEERTARAKKSVEKFEIWWNSFTRNQKLDLIAGQITSLELLKNFKQAQHAEEKSNGAKKPEKQKETASISRPKTKVGSDKLSTDELFIKWSTNNLKLFEQNLSEADKDTLHLKRMQRLVEHWTNMSGAERTDYISKMKAGSEPARFTMIDAWNKSKDLILDLSAFLKAAQIFKPADMLYSNKEFSLLQSKLMTEFWESHPDYGTKLGNQIKASQQKVNMAISRGTFEELKKEIMRDKNQRVKEIEKIKASQVKTSLQNSDTPDYMKEFRTAYTNYNDYFLKNLPQNYIDDYFSAVGAEFSKELILSWTKNLNSEPLTNEDLDRLKTISDSEPPSCAKMSRAIEAACADILYECTKDPEVYTLFHTDVKIVLSRLIEGRNPIRIMSGRLNHEFEFHVEKRKFDKAKLAASYDKYSRDLSENEVDEIISSYFVEDESTEELRSYIKQFGKSALIVFSDKSAYPKEIKERLLFKFKASLPVDLRKEVKCYLYKDNAFELEEDLKRANFLYQKKFDFVPSGFINSYFKDAAVGFRSGTNNISLDTFINEACTKRKDIKSRGRLAIFPKNVMPAELQLKTLAMEEALADVLYEVTGNTDVYSLEFEELCDNIEIFSLSAKFPSEERNYPSNRYGNTISLSAKRKPDVNKINRLYKEYMDELTDWINTDVKESGKAKFEDLLYILNPDENMPEKDEAVSKRIRLYKMNLH